MTEPQWLPIDTAPIDGTEVYVYAAEYDGLPPFITTCAYHPDGGWCVDELRPVTHWMPKESKSGNIVHLPAVEAKGGDDGREPTPAEQIVIDVMGAALNCVVVLTPEDEEPMDLLAFLRARHTIGGYGFADDSLLDTLRDKGYKIRATDTALTISTVDV